MKKNMIFASMICLAGWQLAGCSFESTAKPRLSLFVGVDISGSFVNSPHYDDAIDFLANYLYCHLNGLGGLEVPNALFVGSIGGALADEPKTFYPKQTFSDKSAEEIATILRELFPRKAINPFTDYNSFFQQVAFTVKNRNLVLRPVSVVMLSDGIPDVKKKGKTDFGSLVLAPLEKISRNVTIRLLYTNAVVGVNWQTKVPRKRVKVWTQDAEVMATWKDPKILLPGLPLEKQDKLFAWIKDNVDFGVRTRRLTWTESSKTAP